MIVIMRPGTSRESLQDLEGRIRAAGLEAKVSPGEARDVLLVLGETREKNLEALLENHPAVERLVPVLPQRRYERLFSRRSFLDGFVAAVAGVFAFLGVAVAVFFLSSTKKQGGQRTLVPVSSEDEFARRPYHLIEVEGQPVLVVRTSASEFHALSAICTHSEICQVDWDAKREQMVCPCHHAAYDLFGNVLHGPPPRPLRAYPVAVIGGQVYVKARG